MACVQGTWILILERVRVAGVGFAPAALLVPWGVCSCPSVSEEVGPWEAACCPGEPQPWQGLGVLGPAGLFGAPQAFSAI